MNKVIDSLFQDMKKHSLEKGQLLISSHEQPRGVHYIHSGYVKAYDITSNGDYQITALKGPGDLFPLHWSLGGESRALFYETMCDTVFSFMPKENFKKAINDNTEALQAVIDYLLQAFHYYEQRIQNLEYFSAHERVAFRLLFLAKHFAHVEDDNTVIDVPITYQDIANAINSTRDTVNRIMREFENEGIISRSNKTLFIEKPEQLKVKLRTEHS